MTPQQANEVLRAALKKISETRFGWDGDCGVTSIAEEALDATADCAPAPTEPAVDRDAVRDTGLPELRQHLKQAGIAGESITLSHPAAWALYSAMTYGPEGIATPASPAVPGDPELLALARQAIAASDKRNADPVLAREAMESFWADHPAVPAVPAPAPLAPSCRMQGGICACRSGGSFGGCAIERNFTTPFPERPAAPQLPQASHPTSTPAPLVPSEDAVAWRRPAFESEFTPDSLLAAYWQRKGSTVTPLYEHPAPPATAPMHRLICQLASLKSRTPEAVNLLVEEAKRVMGQDGGAEGGGYYIPKPPPPRPQRPAGPAWTDAEREEYRKNIKRGERCPECSVIEGGGHFTGCPRGK